VALIPIALADQWYRSEGETKRQEQFDNGAEETETKGERRGRTGSSNSGYLSTVKYQCSGKWHLRLPELKEKDRKKNDKKRILLPREKCDMWSSFRWANLNISIRGGKSGPRKRCFQEEEKRNAKASGEYIKEESLLSFQQEEGG